jgi:hypothetical protein
LVGVVHYENEGLGYSGELPARVVMMEHEGRNSLTDLTSNFRHEQFEGEMKLRLALPCDAWESIGRGESITTGARAHLARLAEAGNGGMA